MYQDWMEKIPVTGTIEDVPEEKEYPHIIEEINYPCDSLDWLQDMTNQKLKDKINEIIREVNKMMRGR